MPETNPEKKRLHNLKRRARETGVTLEAYLEARRERQERREAARLLRENHKHPDAIAAEIEQALATVPDWWRKMAIRRLTSLAIQTITTGAPRI
ncbi:hypothetical protein ACXEH2_005018 [Klebsiella pneumoniae]